MHLQNVLIIASIVVNLWDDKWNVLYLLARRTHRSSDDGYAQCPTWIYYAAASLWDSIIGVGKAARAWLCWAERGVVVAVWSALVAHHLDVWWVLSGRPWIPWCCVLLHKLQLDSPFARLRLHWLCLNLLHSNFHLHLATRTPLTIDLYRHLHAVAPYSVKTGAIRCMAHLVLSYVCHITFVHLFKGQEQVKGKRVCVVALR